MVAMVVVRVELGGGLGSDSAVLLAEAPSPGQVEPDRVGRRGRVGSGECGAGEGSGGGDGVGGEPGELRERIQGAQGSGPTAVANDGARGASAAREADAVASDGLATDKQRLRSPARPHHHPGARRLAHSSRCLCSAST